MTFTKGQPLGFFCSWPLFKLTHHMLVWIAAERDEVTRDFSPVSAKMLRSLVGSVATPIFSKIRDVTGTMSLSLTYRLRGASYRIRGATGASLSLYAFAGRRIPVTIETVVSISEC